MATLKQRFGYTVQEYTTEFHNQAMVLGINVDDYDVFMKYTRDLTDYICRELKLFTIESIEDATMKAIATEGKNKRVDKKEDKKPINKSDRKKEEKGNHKTIIVIIFVPTNMQQRNVGYFILSCFQKMGKTTKREMTRRSL